MRSRTFAPHTVRHVQLQQQQQWPRLERHPAACYVVFWWLDIALGHLFMEPDAYASEAAYQHAIQTTLQGAVEHYVQLSPAANHALLTKPQTQDFAHWHRWLQALLAPWQPAVLPAQVPVTVIVCTRNRSEQLRRCLQELQSLPCAPAEIVVVDNAPSDDRTRLVAQAFATVVYLKEPRPGLDIARNTGIVTAQQPVVAFVDDDVVVHPWLVYRVWEAFQDPTKVALTGLVLPLSLQTEAQLIFEKFWSFNRGYVDKVYATEFMHRPAGQVPPVWEIGAGANMAFRTSLFKQVGYFHELLDVGAAGCSGDSEMWHRILARGYAVHYDPRAVVYHEHRREMTGLKQQLFYYVRGHVAAALVQHEQHPQHGYRRHVFVNMPTYYAHLMRAGIPFFRFRYRTLWAEIKGLVSGIAYYYRTRDQAPKSSS